MIGGGTREGPRLKELAATTSSYGTPLPRHFGLMRVSGTIIWATDLAEHNDRQGGGKGRPSTNTYSYTASFAVALASRPIKDIGRVWADGNLLRGAAGDLKVGGTMRLHRGTGDQPCDPLLASAEGLDACPAFRGVAYVVFEDLHLGDFGNRIPALTFEVLADDYGPITLDQICAGVIDGIDAAVPLDGVRGLSCEGALGDLLAGIDPIYPMRCDAGGGPALILAGERRATTPLALPEPATLQAAGDFGGGESFARKRVPPVQRPSAVLRYYDI